MPNLLANSSCVKADFSRSIAIRSPYFILNHLQEHHFDTEMVINQVDTVENLLIDNFFYNIMVYKDT